MINPMMREPGVACEGAQLAENIYAAPVGQDLVLLDLATDEYLLLPEVGDIAVDGGFVRGEMDALLALAADGLLHSGEPLPVRSHLPPVPGKRLPAVLGTRPGLEACSQFGKIWLDAVRRRPTLQSLASKTRGRVGRRDDFEGIAARVEVFHQLMPLAPGCGACLFRAEVLLRFLNAADLDADWVFGVRTWPFLAHCWLQVGDHAVGQDPETLIIYRPIMVL